MDTIPCLGCGTILNLSDTSCPICLRGRSKYEITRAYAQVRADKSRRRRRPFIILAALLAGGTIASTVYDRRAQVSHAYDVVRARLTRFVDDMRDPAHYAAHPPDKSDARPQSPTPVPVPAGAGGRPRRPASAPAAPKNIQDMDVPPMDPGMWAVYGRVYDLKTLRPAGGVRIDFAHSTAGRAGSSESDADGRYLVALPRSDSPGGYEAVCRDARYLKHVFHETDIPYAGLSSADRERLIDGARSGDSHSTPLADIAGAPSRRLDLFLAPRR